jgi:hypothetical protein
MLGLLPSISIASISGGQEPFSGSSQKAGHRPWPAGSCARISKKP